MGFDFRWNCRVQVWPLSRHTKEHGARPAATTRACFSLNVFSADCLSDFLPRTGFRTAQDGIADLLRFKGVAEGRPQGVPVSRLLRKSAT